MLCRDFLVFAACIAAGTLNASAACRSASKVLARTLAQATGSSLNSGARFFRANAYIGAGCLDNALAELDLSDQALATEKFSQNDFLLRKRSSEALRAYVGALKLLESGQRSDAVEKLFELMDSSRSTDVMWRTTMTLGELLTERSTAQDWARFDESLALLSSSEAKFWQVDLFRRLKEVRDGRADAALAALDAELRKELPSQRFLSLQVVVVDVLVADKRYLNARVYCNWMDNEIGEELIDVEQRLRYLRACRTAWNEAPSGSSGVAGRAARVFDAAVRAFEDEL
jgi:hypothetical protein